MEVKNQDVLGGSLQISTEVVEKIAKIAALEVDGVAKVTCSVSGVKGILHRVPIQKPVLVELVEDVAEITIRLALNYGCKAPYVCEKVQQNIKAAIQNMTHVTVSKVNVIVNGVVQPMSESKN